MMSVRVSSMLLLLGLIAPALGASIGFFDGEDRVTVMPGCEISPDNNTCGNHTLSGLVYDDAASAEMEGIAGATVTIWGGCYILDDYCEDGQYRYEEGWWEPVNVTTDSEGGFEVVLESGYYSITVEKEGYTTAYDWVELWNDTYVEIGLTKLTASLAGTVVDTDGAPIAGAWISLSSWYDIYCDSENGEKVRSDGTCPEENWTYDEYRYFYGSTDADGTYLIHALPGEYLVYIYAEGYEYYEGDITIEEGENIVDFVLEALADPVIMGWVYDGENREPVAGALVEISLGSVYWCEEDPAGNDWTECRDGETSWSYTAVTDADGYFEVTLDASLRWQYVDVTVSAEGYSDAFEQVYVDGVTELNFCLLPEDPDDEPPQYAHEYVYECVDSNDDGWAESVWIYEVYRTKDGSVVYEYIYQYVDEDSDGNPEYVYQSERGTNPLTDPWWTSEESYLDDDGDGLITPIDPSDDGADESDGAEDQGDGSSSEGRSGGPGADELDTIIPVAVAFGLAITCLGAMVLWTARIR